MNTTPVSDLRDHPAHVALQQRMDMHFDHHHSSWSKAKEQEFLTLEDHLSKADYLRHLPSASAFFVYSSPAIGCLTIHCALPLVATELRAMREFCFAAGFTPTFQPEKHSLRLTGAADYLLLTWQSTEGRVLPPV